MQSPYYWLRTLISLSLMVKGNEKVVNSKMIHKTAWKILKSYTFKFQKNFVVREVLSFSGHWVSMRY